MITSENLFNLPEEPSFAAFFAWMLINQTFYFSCVEWSIYLWNALRVNCGLLMAWPNSIQLNIMRYRPLACEAPGTSSPRKRWVLCGILNKSKTPTNDKSVLSVIKHHRYECPGTAVPRDLRTEESNVAMSQNGKWAYQHSKTQRSKEMYSEGKLLKLTDKLKSLGGLLESTPNIYKSEVANLSKKEICFGIS